VIDARGRALVVVAHPDDEVLWCGGRILRGTGRDWRIVTLCRGSDPDRAPRFARALARFGAAGEMGDMDDGPEQVPLDPGEVAEEVARLAGGGPFDLVLTHGPRGEYTRHRRHEEVSRAVTLLWSTGRLVAPELLLFAYDDRGGSRHPAAVDGAPLVEELPEEIWREKRRMVSEVYGFAPGSWEHEITPRTEAFWRFEDREGLREWMARPI